MPVLETLDVANDDFIRTTEQRHEDARAALPDQCSRTPGTSTPATTRARTASAARSSSSPATSSTATGEFEGQMVCPIHGRPVETVSARPTGSSGSPRSATRCSRTTRTNPTPSQPQSALQRGHLVHPQRPAGPVDLAVDASTGASRCRGTPRRSSTSGSTRCSTTPPPSGLGDEPPTSGAAKFAATWPADIHLVGKDILRFHAVIWPAMLMAAGLAAARAGVRPRLAAGRRREDEQDQAHRHRARADHRPLRVGRVPLLLPARDPVRPGRLVLLGGHVRPLHRRAGQRPGQPRRRGRRPWSASTSTACCPAPGAFADADLALADALLARRAGRRRRLLELDFTAGIGAVKGFVDAVNLYVTEQEPWALAKESTIRWRASGWPRCSTRPARRCGRSPCCTTP